MIGSNDFDFSFSGLKSSVLREVEKKTPDEQMVNDICFAVQNSIVEVIVRKTFKAAKKYGVKSILLGGGVAANQALRDKLASSIPLFAPPRNLCTDNGAMIAAAAFYNYKEVPWKSVNADPSLYF